MKKIDAMKSLSQAAREIIKRWDSSAVIPSATMIRELREALKREEAQPVKPECGKREALISSYRIKAASVKLRGPNCNPCVTADDLLEISGMLAADAQEIESLRVLLNYEYAGRKAQQVAVPQGWRLVPVEPTPEMLSALCYEASQGYVMRGYQKMLSFAPSIPKNGSAT